MEVVTCTKCKTGTDLAKNHSWCKPCLAAAERERCKDPDYRKHKRKTWKKFYFKLKLRVFRHYSGLEIPECICCKEKQFEFLTLDHINNDGAEHRKRLKTWSSYKIYKDLEKQGLPKGYQILCFNCNCSRALNGGVCPHKKPKVY